MCTAVSIIIPTHNPRREYLARTLEALKRQTLAPDKWELVVVDNKSEDIGFRILDIVRDSGVKGLGGLGSSKSESEKRKAEKPPPAISDLPFAPSVRVVRENKLGLTHARVRGFQEAQGEIVVMVDDDNVLKADYLERAMEILEKNPRLGAIGGKALPEFEIEPPEWLKGRSSGLGLRDLGDLKIVYPVFDGQRSEVGGQKSEGRKNKAESEKRKAERGRVRRKVAEFPECAPIGAGMVIRREAALEYVARIQELMGESVASGGSRVAGGQKSEVGGRSSFATSPSGGAASEDKRKGKAIVTDRKGKSLASGGDNDICLTALEHGWGVGYFPDLELTHLIPKERMTVEYQCRMARDAMRSYIVMLDQHRIRPWLPISRWSVPLRVARAWWRDKPWKGVQGHLNFQNAVGQFLGRADIGAM